MFYTGLDPYTMKPVFVAKTAEEKQMQRALLQYYKPENKAIIFKALKAVNRLDLVGNTKEHLITPPAGFVSKKPIAQKRHPIRNIKNKKNVKK
jgi:hypothetical protein